MAVVGLRLETANGSASRGRVIIVACVLFYPRMDMSRCLVLFLVLMTSAAVEYPPRS